MLIWLVSDASAQETLRAEPPPFRLPAGQVVYVDDKTCPRGQIKEVTGGSMPASSGDTRTTVLPRQRRCVVR